jgi:hypothetical protein
MNETNDLVQTLRQLGYRTSLRILPFSTFFAYTNDSRNYVQVIDGGWSADSASAGEFIGKLTCAYFVPATESPPPTPANSATPVWTGRSPGPLPSKPPTRPRPPLCGHS